MRITTIKRAAYGYEPTFARLRSRRLGDDETQGDVFHHPTIGLGCGSLRRVSFRSGSARLGRSQKDGLPSRSRGVSWTAAQGHQLAHRGGAARSLPLQIERKMGAKRTRGLVLLAALSLFCASTAWVADHAVFTSVFAALSVVAVLGAAGSRHRR